jgi:hypothetical protein
MNDRSFLRGYPIYIDGDTWRYEDTNDPTTETWQSRPCGSCDRNVTAEGHDGCLGSLAGVMNACCGHGRTDDAYVQLASGDRVEGRDATNLMRKLGGTPPADRRSE